MNYKDFKDAIALNDNEPRNYEKIIFRTPDGTNYHNVTIDFGYWNISKDKAMIVNLFNIKPKFKVGDKVTSQIFPECGYTIKEINEEEQYYSYKEINGKVYFKDQDKLKLVSIGPKFHVGDVVTNISGLYPNVTPTISEVNIENQYYRYKEIGGITWFKEQDNLKLVDTKPIFKIGDKVKGVSSEEPEKEFIINSINDDIKCYHYFNGNGIITMFKDQHKLTLVQTDNSRHPVEDNTDTAIIENNIVEDIALYLNIEEVKTIQSKAVGNKIGSDIIKSIIKDIKKAAAEGKSEIKIKYKDYNISNNNIPYVCYWAKICGFIVSCYEQLMYIKW